MSTAVHAEMIRQKTVFGQQGRSMAGIFRVSLGSETYNAADFVDLEYQSLYSFRIAYDVGADSSLVIDITGKTFGLNGAYFTSSAYEFLQSPTQVQTYGFGPLLFPSSGAYYLDWRGSSGSATFIAGDFADLLFGGAGADTLTGGGGNDTFSGSVSNLDGDTITDFSIGDRLVVEDADLSSLDGLAVTGTIGLSSGKVLSLQGTFVGRYWSASYDSGTGRTTLQVHAGPVITVPLSLEVQPGATLEVSGVVFADPDASETDLLVASFTTDLVFASLSAPGGVMATTPAVGASGTITLTGTLAQLNQVVVRYKIATDTGGASSIQVALDDQDAATPAATATIDVALKEPDPVDPPTTIYPIVENNSSGGHNITITDPAQLTASLGTSGVDHVFYGGSGTVTLPSTIEKITLTSGDASARGNALANTLVGSAGDNVLHGMGGNDQMSGGGGHDILQGGSGHDRVNGDEGDDILRGEAGNDRIAGGLGRDKLWGGSGADIFVFKSIQDSKTGSQRDVIYDFRSGQDRIDLRGIDANERQKGNQVFSWTGTKVPFLQPEDGSAFLAAGFTGQAGQLRFAKGILMGDTDGDRRADFQIKIIGSFSSGDVIL